MQSLQRIFRYDLLVERNQNSHRRTTQGGKGKSLNFQLVEESAELPVREIKLTLIFGIYKDFPPLYSMLNFMVHRANHYTSEVGHFWCLFHHCAEKELK